MSIDYTIFYKDAFDPSPDWAKGLQWDVFLSAFNPTERVQRVYQSANAAVKHWIVHNEYGLASTELPTNGAVYAPPNLLREDDFMQGWLSSQSEDLSRVSLCVDISGFMRPHLIFFLCLLHSRGVRTLDALYSEPSQYARRELTEFAHGDVNVADVRPVAGFEGQHQPSISGNDDLLVIGAGYEHQLMSCAANAKNNARKLQMLGFPPLQADFYQENVLNANRAAESVGALNQHHPLFAPSRDPFVTAAVLQSTLDEQRRKGVRNVYLCPLASRPQALGFALYYLYEARGQPVSIIYPFASQYSRETATGLAKIWKYRIELPP
jgi:hypothetical protein